MMDNISPEEKLLRAIKARDKENIAVDNKSAKTTTDLKPPTNYSLYHLIQKYLSFLYIRKIILVVFIASCIYLIVPFVYSWFGLKRVKLPDITQENIAKPKIELEFEVKPYEFYLEGIRERQIFSIAAEQKTEKPVSSVDVDLIKDINLVGIISGKNPQAVIEDRKNQKTYYLSKGQFMGEFQVEDIQEGKVILNYKGQRFELYL